MINVCAFTCLIVFHTSCEDDSLCIRPVDCPERNDDKVSIEQGIWGDVWFSEGDFMPVCPSGTITAVAREIRVHLLTTFDDVVVAPDANTSFYSEINSDLVATTWSGNDGFFEVELPPGQYSIFVVEDTLFYANSGDGAGNINPIEVFENEVSEILININYEASY